jgi:hypothetical protein
MKCNYHGTLVIGAEDATTKQPTIVNNLKLEKQLQDAHKVIETCKYVTPLIELDCKWSLLMG